jgi:hypothetical protein
MSSSLSIAPSSLLTAWWRPTLGILVAALGVLMLSAGMDERTRSALPGDSLPGQQQAREAGMVPRAPPDHLTVEQCAPGVRTGSGLGRWVLLVLGSLVDLLTAWGPI